MAELTSPNLLTNDQNSVPGASGVAGGDHPDQGAPSERVTLQANDRAAARMRILGDVVGLMLASAAYRNLLISDIEWRILPPISAGQCRLIRQGELPIAFVSWARVTSDVEERILSSPDLRLTSSDWKSGDRNCVIDIIALPPVVDAILASIGQNIFAGGSYTVRGLPPDQLSKMREVLTRSLKAP